MRRRVMLVTGAASGIGRSCAQRAVARGDHVVAIDCDATLLDTLSLDVSADGGVGGTIEPIEVDVANVARLRRAVATSSVHGFDAVVHAAGVVGTATLRDLDEAEYDRVVRVNQRAAFFLLQAATERMSSGAIVVVASVAARGARRLQPHYGASKAAVLSLVWSAAATYGPAIRVNAVCPGVIETPMYWQLARERHAAVGTPTDAPFEAQIEALPLGRVGRADEVASVIEFLLSDAASYVTGQAINVCGGLVNG